MAKNISFGNIANALKSTANDHILGVAGDIYDENLNNYQDDLNNSFNSRLSTLEAIDHDDLAAAASAAAVATVLDGAPEKFNTLKEIAQWISDSETAASAADLVTRVETLEDSKDKYIAADDAVRAEFAAADNTLKSDIEKAYKAADSTLETNITSAYTTADSTLETNITSAYTTADSTLETNITKAYTDADAALNNSITKAYTDADANVSKAFAAADATLGSTIRSEFATADANVTKAYKAADSTLETNITKAYTDADAALNNSITKAYTDADANVSKAFAAADASLGSSIRSEFATADANITKAYKAADSTLETNITKAYTDADAALNNSITKAYTDADANVTKAFAAADATLGSTIRSEFATADANITTAYTTADATLKNEIKNAIGGLSTKVDLTSNQTIGGTKTFTNTINGKTYESLLQWGNTNMSGSLSPIDVGMDSQWSSNRLSFMPASGIDIKYSTDGGSTWTDYGLDDNQKRSLVTTGLSCSLYMGKNSTNQIKNSYRLRVTITADSGITYFSLKKIYMYVSQNGATDCRVIVEKAKCGSDTSFELVGPAAGYGLSGWSGWNSIPLTASFGGGDGQTTNIRRLRFTYYFNNYSTGYGPEAYATNSDKGVKFLISKLNMIGENSWTNSGGNLPATGHIYSYDIDKNTTFPAGLISTGPLTVNGNTTLHGRTTISTGGGLTIKGASQQNPLITRSIKGSDGSGNVGELYINYGESYKVHFGTNGAYTISEDGSNYTGNAATATKLKGPDGYVGDSKIWHETSLNFAQKRTTAITTTQGSTTDNRYYGVELDKNGKAFVNVPWTDTNDSINIKNKIRPLATGNKLVNNSIHYISSSTTIQGFNEPPANEVYTYTIILNNIGPKEIGFPSAIKWAGGDNPTKYTSAGLYEIVITGINPGSGNIIYTATWAKYS